MKKETRYVLSMYGRYLGFISSGPYWYKGPADGACFYTHLADVEAVKELYPGSVILTIELTWKET